MSRFYEHFIKDAHDNPPYFTTAEIVEVCAENMSISIAYTDKHGQDRTHRIKVESSTEFKKICLGSILDIQICDGLFPALFYCVHQELIITE